MFVFCVEIGTFAAKSVKTGEKWRQYPILREQKTVIGLSQQQKQQLMQKLAMGEDWIGWSTQEERKTALVFTMENGSGITPATLWRHFKDIVKEIGVPECRVHDLRHTYVVLSLQNGDDVKTVQSNLGHATASFTIDVYGHVSDKMREESAARMQAYFNSLTG